MTLSHPGAALVPAGVATHLADLLPPLEGRAPEDMPPPFRALLDHQGGMTAALEAAVGHAMVLTELRSKQVGDRLIRAVLLGGIEGPAAEVGLIEIHLQPLAPPVRAQVVAATAPFGRILGDAGLIFTSRPVAFLKAAASDPLAERLGVSPEAPLYGRSTVLRDAAGVVLAEAIELLGPAAVGGYSS